MGEFELKRFADPASLASEVARDWLDLLRTCSKGHPFCVALPGGRIAPLLFSAFATRVKAEGVDLSAVHFFWRDERCVPPFERGKQF